MKRQSQNNPILVANWKMCGDLNLVSRYIKCFSEFKNTNADLVICPPYVYIQSMLDMKNKNSNLKISIGAQSIHRKNEDTSITGSINGRMIKDVGCEYVIIGHNETRKQNLLTTEDIYFAILSALKNQLKVIFCIGEENQSEGLEEAIIEAKGILENIDKKLTDKIIIAYEPVWAIGSGVTPSLKQIDESAIKIKRSLKVVGSQSRVIYGGSVNEKNSKSILKLKSIDGIMVGGASLDVDKIKEILSQA